VFKNDITILKKFVGVSVQEPAVNELILLIFFKHSKYIIVYIMYLVRPINFIQSKYVYRNLQ
jgi:hypothetical protein